MTLVTLDTRAQQRTPSRPKFLMTFSLASAGTLAMALIMALAPVAQARPVPQSFADLAEQVSPAVVTVSTVQKVSRAGARPGGALPEIPLPEDSPLRDFFEHFFDGEQFGDQPFGGQQFGGQQPGRPASGVGSGFIMDPEGYVVTNNHVIAGAEEIKVILKDGQSFEAMLIGRDDKTDLALLKIESREPLPFVRFGDSDRVRVGDWVMAVGNPFGLGGTVTAGIVSARGRDLAGGTLVDYLQIDAPINRGNSGGPAFNDSGEVIGINTAIYSPNGGSVGIGFAIPSNLAGKILADLRENGKVERGWLGVRIQPVTPDIAEGFGLDQPHGALIAAVDDDSPAARAGLEPGDVVLSWNGKDVKRFKDLPRLVAVTPAGQETEVTVWRNRKAETLEVVTGSLPQQAALEQPRPKAKKAAGTLTLEGTGLTVANLTPELRLKFRIGEEVEGAVVVAVADYSPAAEQGIQVGDVIASVALTPVASARETAAQVAALRKDGSPVVMFKVRRQGSESFFALRLADA